MQALRSLIGESPTSPKVLFIGNSLTSYRAGSVDAMCRKLGFEATAKVTYGATLAEIWAQGGWAQTIGAGGYDFVVLQDDLPEYDSLPKAVQHWRELLVPFLRVVTSFVSAIRAAGATPVLYLAHAYSRLALTQQHDINLCHVEAEKALSVAIAPCGLAHHLAHPRLLQVTDFSAPLLEPDREHPSVEGLYLNACCLALVLRGGVADAADASALEAALPWAPEDFEGDKADFLRQVARDAVVAWRTYEADTAH